MLKQFYTYLWLRENGTPYYVGKGQGNRAFIRNKHRQHPPDDCSRIVVQDYASEQDALMAEVFLIAFYGRLDLGTGCLRNLTDGGEGTSGYRATEETRQKFREGRKGERNSFFGKTHSTELRQAVAVRNKNRVWTREQRERISATVRGRKFSDDSRKKMSLIALARPRKEGGQFASTR